MICSDFGDIQYYVEKPVVGAHGYITQDDEVNPIKVVSKLDEGSDKAAYQNYISIPQEDRNKFMDAEWSAAFLLEGHNIILGMSPLKKEDIHIDYYC